MRSIIKDLVPDAEEKINYDIPAMSLIKGGKRDKQIVPRPVLKLLNSDDKAKAERAMNAVLTMKRLVITDIEKAAYSKDD